MDNEVPSPMIPDSLSLSFLLPAESDVTCERVVIVTRLLRPDDPSVGRSAKLAENFKAVGHTASAAAPF